MAAHQEKRCEASLESADGVVLFHRLAQGKTAIVITHRFTTAMLADEIRVMEDGRIVESGSHLELMARGGRYAEWGAMQSLQGEAKRPG